jgi:sensor domain CHASE-containing protein
MSLRWKVLIFVFGVSATFAATALLVQALIVLPGFEEAESDQARNDLARCTQALQLDCDYVSRSAADYARWDDTYAFVEDRNSAYIAANLIPETFENLHINLLVFVRSDGTLVWGEVRSNGAEEVLEAPELLRDLARPDHVLVAHTDTDSRTMGVLMTSLGPMLVGSHPITTSHGAGPIRGAVIMGRLFDEEAVQQLAARTRVSTFVWPVDAVPEEDRAALGHLYNAKTTWILDQESSVLHGYTLIRDVFGAPALLLRADIPRTISSHGRTAAGLGAVSSLIGGAVICMVMWGVLARLVLKPLGQVTAHAVRVGARDDLHSRLHMSKSDEIGTLAREFDRMVERLAESRAQMLEVARHAGQAEVATNVLHNVGNVLTSVNVSANLVRDKLSQSEISSLGRATQMLVDHGQDLAAFLTQDERGRALPGFLIELSQFLTQEHDAMLREMQSVADALEHIRRVVSMQQVHARNVTLIETIELGKVVEQALALAGEVCHGQGVQIVRRIDLPDAVPIDRHKLLQILVNLISNARQALRDSSQSSPQITIALTRAPGPEGDVLRVTVEDNGVGISAENLPKIFNLGFSTRPGGHGFGLHSAANLAREMGGSLTAASEGPGRGAAFTLEVPLQSKESGPPCAPTEPAAAAASS